MTIVSERVASYLVRHRGEAYCEDCIQREVGIARRRQVHDALELLGLDRGQRYLRLRVPCSMCNTERVVSASR